MNRILSNLMFILLLLTLAVACQKDEIVPIKTTDTLEVRTLEFDIPTLWSIHDNLRTEVNALIEQGILNPPNGNGLIPQLNNLKRAIENAEEAEVDPIEANQILEEDILPHLAGLLDDGVLTQELYDGLYNVATNQAEEEGDITITVNGMDYTYHWKLMGPENNKKKWLVENLRHPAYDADGNEIETWFYPEEKYPAGVIYDPDLYGMLYTQDGASAACEALEGEWYLPTNQDWLDLGNEYGTWESGINTGAYQALISGGSSGFNALLGGSRNLAMADYFWGMGGRGYYWTADPSPYDDEAGKYFYFDKNSEKIFSGMNLSSQGNSCRCVCEIE